MLQLDSGKGTALYQQLYEQIKKDILSGAMPEGMRLPSIRSLAKEIRTSKNTVENAYAQLVLEGYVLALPGSGHTVNAVCRNLNSEYISIDCKNINRENPKTRAPQSQCVYDFHYGNLDASTFPAALWRKLLAAVMKEAASGRLASGGMHAYGDAHGDALLRRELAHYLYRSRGVRCTEEQVVICSGLQASIIAVLLLLRQEGASVALEDPTYIGARVVYERFNFKTIPIPVEPDGISITSLKNSPANLVHITPSHQFPTGVIMSISKRIELLNWAGEKKSWIIEDDYDSELRYSGRPIPSLQSIDKHGRVIYMGTFSKVLSPGMRMSYLVLPHRLAEEFRTAFEGFQCPVPWLEQAVLARFMADGHWEKHLRKVCLAKKKKHDVFVTAIRHLFGDRIRIHGHNAGLHLLLELPEESDAGALIARAAEYGVKIYSASPFWMHKERSPGNYLFIGYGMLSEQEIVSALHRLKRAWPAAGCLADSV